MWHVLKKFNRVVARNVTQTVAEYYQSKIGGDINPTHVPRRYNNEEINGQVVGYVSNEKHIYAYGQYIIEADGFHIATVTHKKDAFKIMQALKFDYKDIIVRIEHEV